VQRADAIEAQPARPGNVAEHTEQAALPAPSAGAVAGAGPGRAGRKAGESGSPGRESGSPGKESGQAEGEQAALSRVQKALVALERGRYAEAQALLAECLRQLTELPVAAKRAPASSEALADAEQERSADVRFCAQYSIVCSLLLALDTASHDTRELYRLSERARLSALLGALPLLARHRRVCVGIAIAENLRAQNFGLVASLAVAMGSRPLAQLLPPAQRAELTQLRAQCEAEGLADGSSVLAPCRACGHQTLGQPQTR